MATKKDDETKPTGKEPKPAAATEAAVEADSLGSDIPPKRNVKDRIKDIEKWWGKEFTEVMVDLHDHVFGVKPPHDADEKKSG
jgi:hypothetical protein